MADDDDNDGTTATPPAQEASAPQWAIDLKEAIEGLPGKLQATITDSDKSGIAEAVHGLFEKSGAFESAPPPKEQTTDEAEEDKPADQEERKPDKKGLSGFAEWFEGGK